MAQAIRAKFSVQEVADIRITIGQPKDRERIKLGAVYATGSDAAENVSYAKATPQGTIELVVDNPGAWDFFLPGSEFYVTFTRAPLRCRDCYGQGVIWPGDQKGLNKTREKQPCARCSETGLDPEQPD